MTTTPAESDPFFQLLTDALRAGPDSAQWGEAVEKLRDGGVKGGDEYRLLIRAREDIALGRDYRKVSAGPGFTRKVLAALEREGSRRSGMPTATIVAVLAGLVILGVIVAVIVVMSRGGAATDPQETAVRRLEAASFPVSAAAVTFDGAAGWPPEGFHATGQLPLDATRELKAGAPPTTGPATTGPATTSPATTSPATTGPVTDPAAATQASPKFFTGGLISADAIPPDIAAAVEAELVLPAPGPGQALTQLFVSDADESVPGSTSPPHEIALSHRDGRLSVSVAGAGGQESISLGTRGEPVKVSIRFDRETAIVEAGGRRLYEGPHGLSADKPRYAGLRFVRAADDAGESAKVRWVHVARSASPTGAAGSR